MRILSIFFTFIALGLNAQNHSYYNDFFDNAIFNSAYNNLNKGFKLTGIGYKNFNTPYTPGYFCINGSYTTKSNVNIAGRLVNKHMMFQSFIEGDVIIGHRVSLTAKDSIALSFNAGVASNSFNTQYLNQYTEIDPNIEVFNRSYYNVGSSILYTHSDKFELGLAAPSIVTTNNGIRPLIFTNASYNHKMKDYILRPQVIYFYSNYTSFADFSLQLKYKSLMWGKFAYNTLGTSSYGFGLNLKFAELGYAYRLNSGEFGQNLRGLHLVSISIRPQKM
jgi:hypothetical protein